MSRRAIRAVNAMALLLLAAIVASLAAVQVQRDRGALVVWSCGGNYEFLAQFARQFEAASGVPVSYTAAPVQYLLDLTLRGPRRPDVIVGRAGPGWLALQKQKLLAAPPTFFAVDPLVLAVAPNCQQPITSVEDIGKPGVRVAATPAAMRPKGKVIGQLVASLDDAEDPGLVERWQANMVEGPRCGRHLLDPVIEGVADVSIVPRSLTPPAVADGTVRIVPIAPRHLLRMKEGRPSMPQCAAALRSSSRPGVAARFVAALADPASATLLAASGYIPVTSPEARPYRPMFELSAPRDMPGWQVRLAEALVEHDAIPAAVRRYLVAVCVFGPSIHDGRALCELGDLLHAQGQTDAAHRVWAHAASILPRPLPNEFSSDALQCLGGVPGIEWRDDRYWASVARSRLARDGVPDIPPPGWRPVDEGAPPKGGARQMALAERLAALGYIEAAIKDYLKVCTLNYPSTEMPAAEHAVESLVRQHGRPEPPAALPGASVLMPPWSSRFDTHWARGMTLAMRLYDLGFYQGALKEFIKLCSGEYGADGDQAEARYRCGVASVAAGWPDSAAWQWRVCTALHADSPWAPRAAAAQKTLQTVPGLGRRLPAEDKPESADVLVRLRIAEEFHIAGLWAHDDTLLEFVKVLTVTAPRKQMKGAADITAQATCRLGDCLLARGDAEGGRAALSEVVSRWPKTQWAKQAQATLDREGAR